jgi:hypothetical protein
MIDITPIPMDLCNASEDLPEIRPCEDR